ncbi:hypothetical protein ACF1BQ_034755 [Bradyrhizobium sp. RDT10]
MAAPLSGICPARVMALVIEHVYDTSTGKFLLLPQGARSIGSQAAFENMGC